MLLHIPENDIYQSVETYTKIYPKFVRVFKYAYPIQSRIKYMENEKETDKPIKKLTTNHNPDSLIQSIRRTKTTIQDLVICNEFELFVTFTFKNNRYDINSCKKRMSKWLKNQQEIHGKFKYLIVPEYHKDKALHFHALFKNYSGNLKDSGHKINKRTAYNITSYRLGHNSAVKIDNHDKVSSYVRKYITKDMPLLESKKRYWCSTGLLRPVTLANDQLIHNPFVNFTEEFTIKGFTCYRADVTVQTPLIKLESLNGQRTTAAKHNPSNTGGKTAAKNVEKGQLIHSFSDTAC